MKPFINVVLSIALAVASGCGEKAAEAPVAERQIPTAEEFAGIWRAQQGDRFEFTEKGIAMGPKRFGRCIWAQRYTGEVDVICPAHEGGIIMIAPTALNKAVLTVVAHGVTKETLALRQDP